MVDLVQPAQDIFGLGRLAQSIRQNRAEKAAKQVAEQNAITRGLQQEDLRLGIQEKKSALDFAQGTRDIKTQTAKESLVNPEGESDIALGIKNLRAGGRGDLADELMEKTEKRAFDLIKVNPKAGEAFYNNNIAGLIGLGKLKVTDHPKLGKIHTFTDPRTGKKINKIIDENTGKFIDLPGAEGLELSDEVDGKTDLQKTGAYLVKDESGNTSIATGVFNPSTGTLKTATAEIPNAQLVSKLGETGIEETERKVSQKREETRVTGEEKRASELIDRGVLAAESTATIRRAVNLLDDIKTGGFSNAALRAKQIFGIESADEGELSNSLGKAVLSQLRETFGAAFTESEGDRLARIEASFGKSTEANKRLLTQALKIAERTAKRARKAAEKRGDTDTVADLDELLSFDLSPPEQGNVEKPITKLSDDEILEALNAN